MIAKPALMFAAEMWISKQRHTINSSKRFWGVSRGNNYFQLGGERDKPTNRVVLEKIKIVTELPLAL